MPEQIPIGADHAGFQLKERLVTELRSLGYDVLDLGTKSADSVDYPDFAHPVASLVERGEAKKGILLCGTGIGMAIAANRHRGVRAGVIWTSEIAKLSRQHNDLNVLVFPARFVSEDEAVAILLAWLDTPFEGGRHTRRVTKMETA
jgi:ribose 5-phosphate isomerase B